MSISIQETKMTCHVRSTSLPPASHPLIVNAEEQLERLKSSQATSVSSICHNLSDLVELYDSVDDVLHLSHFGQKTSAEGILDGSLRLLDLVGSIRDALSIMKGSMQELESTLCRKRGGMSNEISAYMISRKKLSKLICKSFEDLKRMEKSSSTASSVKQSDLSDMSTFLGEIERTSLTVFCSLLSYISQPKSGSKSKTFPFVSKLLQSGRVSCQGEEDIELVLLHANKSTKEMDFQQVQNVQKKLKALEMNIQELEEGMEVVFRRLVKTRVSLLNILSN